MAVTLNANTSTGFIATSDTSGVLQLQTGGTTALTVDASQNVGIGTNSPAARLDVSSTGLSANFGSSTAFAGALWKSSTTTGVGRYVAAEADAMTFGRYGVAEHMRIDSSGNVGIGTNSPPYRLSVAGVTGTGIASFSGNNNGFLPGTDKDSILVIGGNFGAGFAEVDYFHNNSDFKGTSGGHRFIQRTGASTSSELMWLRENLATFSTAGIERMRIDSSGQVGVGMAGAGTVRLSVASGTSYIMVGRNSAGTTDQFRIEADGDVENVNNVYRAISDVKIKENITDATPKLKKLCQVRVVSYNLKDGLGYGTHKQIGVVAQELEPIFPGMVEESPDYEEVTTTDEDGNETTERVATGTTTKSVKYSVFVPMLIKAIQEQQAIITSLTDRITALEGTTP